ncbi:MAG: prepilin-type N-terminal cleavage/methylation domain-containing protein [Patescibacteria group bacterium]|jgi:prepilin-type N-terminal cleavage/methylation domain-containing protein
MKQKSFTLIELLVAVTIFVIVVAIGLATVVTLTQNRTKSETNTSIQTSGNLAMETIVNEVQNASSYSFTTGTTTTGTLTVVSGGNTYQFSRAVDTNGVGYIGMMVSGTFGSTGLERLTSPNVSIGSGPTDLNFSGLQGSFTTKNYVTIDMTLHGAFASSTETPLTLHTTTIAQL